MAQAGYTPISLYYSTTSTQEPTAGNLVSGELAINIADGKLFYKNSAGNVRLLSIGYGSSSVTPTNGGVQYGTGTALALTAAGSSGQILRSNGAAAPTWADLSTLGVNTISFGTTGLTPNSATAGAVTVAGTLVTANGGTGLGGATPFTANGVLYASSASALTSGSALTFNGSTLATSNANASFTSGSATTAGVITSGAAVTQGVIQFGSGQTTYNIQGGPDYVGNVYNVATGSSHQWAIATSEQMRLTSTGLGIGTSSPTRQLQVSNASNAIISALNGSIEGVLNATTTNVNVGSASNHFLTISTNGSERARITSGGDLLVGTTTALGRKIVVGGDSTTGRVVPAVDDVGYVGDISYRWQAIYAVNGTIQTSDGRQKNTIEDSNLGLGFINALRPVSYKWNVGENLVTYDDEGKEVVTPRPGVRTHYGFIAQEVKAAIPNGVDFGGFVEEPNDGPMSLRYHEFIGPMVKAIQEQQAIITALTARVALLEGN